MAEHFDAAALAQLARRNGRRPVPELTIREYIATAVLQGLPTRQGDDALALRRKAAYAAAQADALLLELER